MNDADLRRLKDAFNTWASNMPNPDQPIVGFSQEKMLSPRQLAEEVEKETETGKDWLAILEHGVAKEGIDKVVQRLTAPKP